MITNLWAKFMCGLLGIHARPDWPSMPWCARCHKFNIITGDRR